MNNELIGLNPNTGDNVYIYFIGIIVLTILTIGLLIYLKKKNKK